jgi:alkyl hydroperoxide reductase 1
LPPYAEKYDQLKAKGVDAVYVLSANDPFVLSGWTRVQGVAEKVRSLASAPIRS